MATQPSGQRASAGRSHDARHVLLPAGNADRQTSSAPGTHSHANGVHEHAPEWHHPTPPSLCSVGRRVVRVLSIPGRAGGAGSWVPVSHAVAHAQPKEAEAAELEVLEVAKD